MRRTLYWLLIPALLLIFTIGLAACGDDDDGDGGDGAVSAEEFAPTTEPPDDAKKGGTLTVVMAADVEYLDPGATYYQIDFLLSFGTQRTLVGWPPNETEEPQPDLAESAEVSEDGKTITFKIKDGISYSPPVDREIRAADFKYAIERATLPGVGNAYFEPYFGEVVGYQQALKAIERDPTTAPEISGITTPDDRTLVIEFAQPVARAALQALSLGIGAPVPEEYAKEFDADSPSTYDQHLVGTGPYMIENDEQGNLTGYSPGKEIIVVRNPNWDPSTDYRPAYLDRIEFKEGFTDVNSATRRILSGDAQLNGDILPEPEGLKLAATEYPDQLELVPGSGNRYVALNTQLPPFDDINVRKAVLAAADRDAFRLERGGPLVGELANHFIMPTLPGFEEAGGLEGFGFDFLADPNGNPELAADYFRKAGYASGKYEGDEEILMVGENAGVDRRVAEATRDLFVGLGFKVDFRQVTSDIMYEKFCGVPKAKVHVCPNVGWIKDFNDGQAILDVPFSGASIVPVNNANWPQLDVPAINKAIDEASLVSDPAERAQAWADVDRMVTAQAPGIIYLWDSQPNVRSADVNGVINQFAANWDLSHTSLKNP